MRRQLWPAVRAVVLFTLVLGLGYPLAMTAIGQVAFSDGANGSLVERDGIVIGSRLIGQQFDGSEYFQSRPSPVSYAPGPGYAYASNEGPTSERFLFGEDDPETEDVDESETSGVDDRVRAYREANGLDDSVLVPVDAVTGSGSGLDPHISIANARMQAPRVAEVRGLDEAVVDDLVEQYTLGRTLGIFGEARVSVLELNLALDEL